MNSLPTTTRDTYDDIDAKNLVEAIPAEALNDCGELVYGLFERVQAEVVQ